jgi:hypothetical protein
MSVGAHIPRFFYFAAGKEFPFSDSKPPAFPALSELPGSRLLKVFVEEWRFRSALRRIPGAPSSAKTVLIRRRGIFRLAGAPHALILLGGCMLVC